MSTVHKLFELVSKIYPDVIIYKVDNYDDVNDGFEYNPATHIMIMVKVSFTSDFIHIIAHQMNIYTQTLKSYTLVSGSAIRTDDGEIDYDLYMKILRNFHHFMK